MNKQSFIKLLRKFLDGKASYEEEQFLISYYTLFETEPDVVSLLTTEQQEELRHSIFCGITDRINLEEVPVIPLYKRIPYAAAAAVILIVGLTGLFFFQLNIPDEAHTTTFSNGTPSNQLVNLADGSSILLSPGSRITYPISFTNLRSREVVLDGEAFFDIRRDPSKPFIIETGKLKTRVLGTSFNIQAFQKESNITVTVMRGKVEVSAPGRTLAQLRPAEQIRYNSRTYKAVRSVVDTSGYITWKNPLLFFDDITVEEACRLISERYKVNIIVTGKTLGSKRFTTSFYKTERLEKVLESICEFNRAKYRSKAGTDTIFITMK